MFRRYRPFFVTLVIMTLVWFVMDMSSMRGYQTTAKVEYLGIDTARYAIVYQDAELPLSVESDGFTALLHHWLRSRHSLAVDLSAQLSGLQQADGARISGPAGDYNESLKKLFGPMQDCSVTPAKDSLTVVLSERRRRSYVPQLRDVSFTFPDGYGLSGTPTLSPDTVYLYGSERSLNEVEAIYTQAATVRVKDADAVYRLALEPVWNNYPDLRVSQSMVTLKVPVEAYVEERQCLKVHFVSDDTTMRVRLYPDQVSVTVWVPRNSSSSDSKMTLKAVVRHDMASQQNELPVTITDFPTDVKIKSVEPNVVQYVIIQK